MRPSASAAEQLVWDETPWAAAVDSRASAATGGSDAHDILPYIQHLTRACQVLMQAATEAETQPPARGCLSRHCARALRTCGGSVGYPGRRTRRERHDTGAGSAHAPRALQVRRRAHGRAQHSGQPDDHH